MAFHVGQKVVCVAASAADPSKWPHVTFPAIGSAYTIREIFEGPDKWAGKTYFRLCEIINPLQDSCIGPFEAGFRSLLFRPVKTTSIGIFTQMLTPVPKRARECA